MDKYCKRCSARFYTEPFTFNAFINDLFFFSAKCEICFFTCDNSLYSCGTYPLPLSKIQDVYMSDLYTIQ